MAHDGWEARLPSPDFPQFFCPVINQRACTGLHLVWCAKLMMVRLNWVKILIIIGILFNPFFRCLLLSEKCCHSLFIRVLTEPDREEVHCQTIQNND